MKKLLFLLLLPFAADAQHFQVNIVGGPSVTTHPFVFFNYKHKVNMFVDGQVCGVAGKWVLGAGVYAQNLTLRSKGHVFDSLGNSIDDLKIKVAEPVIVPYLTIGRNIKLSRLSLVPQVRVGYALGKETEPDFETMTPGHNKSSGVAFGGNIAGSYPLTHTISLRASAGVNYIMLKHEGLFALKNNILTVPIGIGLGVSL